MTAEVTRPQSPADEIPTSTAYKSLLLTFAAEHLRPLSRWPEEALRTLLAEQAEDTLGLNGQAKAFASAGLAWLMYTGVIREGTQTCEDVTTCEEVTYPVIVRGANFGSVKANDIIAPKYL
jgi:hypothetical protein